MSCGEWAWDDAPIILPVAFELREVNAIYTAFHMAEYSGSKVLVVHVLEGDEDHPSKREFKRTIEELSNSLKVRHEYVDIGPKVEPPGVEETTNAIVNAAEQNNAQAIIMSAHREAFFRELFGRVSDHVAKNSRKRVILVESPHPGINIPKNPKRILIPVLQENHPDPFIVAAALTSSASAPNAEIVAAKIIELPPTLPLDAISMSRSLRKEEKEFSFFMSTAIRSLARLFVPKVLPVREVGRDLASYAKENGVDIIVMYSNGKTGFRSFLAKDEYEIVSQAPSVVLVIVGQKTG